MTTPQERLAESLEVLSVLQEQGRVAIRSADLTRTHRERLVKNGFLQPVMKGWYIPIHPEERGGESTAWYASFWSFCADYLQERFGSAWCLSPETSLSLHAGNRAVPEQLIVRSPRSGNSVIRLLHDTELLDIRAEVPPVRDTVHKDGLRLYSVPAALVHCSPGAFVNRATDARAVLARLRSSSEVLELLLEGGHSTIAGRLAGAFRNIGQDKIADEIRRAMDAAGYTVVENDPFSKQYELPTIQAGQSPFSIRIRLMWQQMRPEIPSVFPDPPGAVDDVDAYLKRVQDAYAADAYHSLSIEGYRVSEALIERVRRGDWNPDTSQQDSEQRDALAARGYWQATRQVQKSLRRVLTGSNPGRVAEEEHGEWYRQLFAPSVTVGLIRPSDLAGYRNGPVYIRRSMHVPPDPADVRDAMAVFFEMLTEEKDASVRAVLGHFLFVYIHPYGDGNGRIGRFLMNLMMASGGYPWTIIPVQERALYMASLESASVEQDIGPFTRFLARLEDYPPRLQGRAAGRLGGDGAD